MTTDKPSDLICLNEKLLDANNNLLLRNIAFCKRNHLAIEPETLALLAEVRHILSNIASPTKMKRFNSPTRDETEPKVGL